MNQSSELKAFVGSLATTVLTRSKATTTSGVNATSSKDTALVQSTSKTLPVSLTSSDSFTTVSVGSEKTLRGLQDFINKGVKDYTAYTAKSKDRSSLDTSTPGPTSLNRASDQPQGIQTEISALECQNISKSKKCTLLDFLNKKMSQKKTDTSEQNDDAILPRTELSNSASPRDAAKELCGGIEMRKKQNGVELTDDVERKSTDSLIR